MTLRTLLDRFDLLMDTPESVPKLRRFILQLAIQGRLTEQKPEDEPAEVLINRIQSEKKRLYDAGEIRKPKNLDPVDTAENPFQLPESWVWTRFGTACNIIRGITFSKSDKFEQKKDGRVACLRTANVQEDVVWDDLIFVDPEFVKREEQWLRPGDTLISMSNSYELVGKVAFTNRVPQKTSIGGFLGIVRPYCCFDEEYMYYALNSPLMQQGMRQTSSQTTNIANLALRDIRPLPFPLPPLEEQQRIVETVDRLMDECDALEQQQERERTLQVQVGTAATEALQSADDAEGLRPAWERVREHFDTVTATPEGVDALRQTILQLAVQGRLTEHDPDDTPADMLLERIQQEKQRLYDAGEIRKPKSHPAITDEDEPFDIPEKWTWTRLSNVCILENGDRGKNYPSQSDLVESGIRFINAGHLQDGTVSHDEMDYITEERFDLLGRGKVQAGDLLFCLRGSLGKCALIRNDDRGAIASSLVIVRPLRELMSRYVLTFFGSALCDALIDHYDNGTAQPNLGSTSLAEFAFPLPPPEEQKRIVEKTNRILPLCDELDSYLSKSRDRGEQLLKAALRDGSLNTSADEESIAKPV